MSWGTNLCLLYFLLVLIGDFRRCHAQPLPSVGISYNLPKLCVSATWNPNAITFFNSTMLSGPNLYIIFTTNNIVYVSATGSSSIIVLNGITAAVVRIITNGLHQPRGLFVTSSSDIIIDNGKNHSRIEKWTSNATSGVIAMQVPNSCYSIFVDIVGDLYCSLDTLHLVIKGFSNNTGSYSTTVAGNGTSGSSSTQLSMPQGIYVDLDLNLYVAECGNSRVQRFMFGQLSGTVVAGNGANGTITLSCPTGIIFDADGYLFIVDLNHHRIIRSGPNGFRCVVGCEFGNGSASNQFTRPRSLSFDTDGNLFVLDSGNRRIQRFQLQSNSCGKYIDTDVSGTKLMHE